MGAGRRWYLPNTLIDQIRGELRRGTSNNPFRKLARMALVHGLQRTPHVRRPTSGLGFIRHPVLRTFCRSVRPCSHWKTEISASLTPPRSALRSSVTGQLPSPNGLAPQKHHRACLINRQHHQVRNARHDYNEPVVPPPPEIVVHNIISRYNADQPHTTPRNKDRCVYTMKPQCSRARIKAHNLSALKTVRNEVLQGCPQDACAC